MTDKPSCETCPHYKGYGLLRCEIIDKETDSKSLQIGIPFHTKIVGCLSHPQAREYLMKDVIEELDAKYREAEQHHNQTETFDRMGRWQYATRMDAWGYAITLIRNGVGGK